MDKTDKMKLYLKQIKEYIDSELMRHMSNEEPLLNGLLESINYTLFSGGKRIRPLFCLMAGELFNVPNERLITLACALEMIHTASLIMDDLPHMDGAMIRRGKQANHLVYGQDVATLASIGLLMKAFEVVLNDPRLPDDKKTAVVSNLAKVAGIGGMVGGQFVDLKFSDKSMDYETLEYIHIQKTASLFVTAGKTTAILGNANEDEMYALETYAKNLGFAFQVLDDLMDLQGTVDKVGKKLKKDKGNFAVLYGIKKSKEVVKECTNNAIDAVKIFHGKNDKLIALGQMLLKRKS